MVGWGVGGGRAAVVSPRRCWQPHPPLRAAHHAHRLQRTLLGQDVRHRVHHGHDRLGLAVQQQRLDAVDGARRVLGPQDLVDVALQREGGRGKEGLFASRGWRAPLAGGRCSVGRAPSRRRQRRLTSAGACAIAARLKRISQRCRDASAARGNSGRLPLRTAHTSAVQRRRQPRHSRRARDETRAAAAAPTAPALP